MGSWFHLFGSALGALKHSYIEAFIYILWSDEMKAEIKITFSIVSPLLFCVPNGSTATLVFNILKHFYCSSFAQTPKISPRPVPQRQGLCYWAAGADVPALFVSKCPPPHAGPSTNLCRHASNPCRPLQTKLWDISMYHASKKANMYLGSKKLFLHVDRNW